MSITDNIVEEIAAHCKENETKEFSGEVINDYVENAETINFLTEEIVEKLKAKGISVGP